jgi:hypothetical protein
MTNSKFLYVLPDSESGNKSLKLCVDFDATSPQPHFKRNDYLLISQSLEHQWVGQIADVERIICPMGQYSDNTLEYLRRQVLAPDNVRPLRIVRIFEVRIIGQYFDGELDVPVNNILPGAVASKLDELRIRNLINIPSLKSYEDGSKNVVGIIENAENIPLTFDSSILTDHIGVGGASGRGKSNLNENLIWIAHKEGCCVIQHDAKPDFRYIDKANTDPHPAVRANWKRFAMYGLEPKGAKQVFRIAIANHLPLPDVKVDMVLGFNASDLDAELLAQLLCPGTDTASMNAQDNLAKAIYGLKRHSYTLDNIIAEVEQRNRDDEAAQQRYQVAELIHSATVESILRKINANRKRLDWLDTVGKQVSRTDISRNRHLASSAVNMRVERFDAKKIFAPGRIVVIDYGNISENDENSYAIILEYILRQAHTYVLQSDVNIVEMIDEAHRVFNNKSRRASALIQTFTKYAREGRVKGHWMIVSTQLFSDIDEEVRENLNTRFVMQQNTRDAAKIATENMGADFIDPVLSLGKGKCLVKTNESQAVLQVAIAPSPFELMRKDNRDNRGYYQAPKIADNNNVQQSDYEGNVSKNTEVQEDGSLETFSTKHSDTITSLPPNVIESVPSNFPHPSDAPVTDNLEPNNLDDIPF